MAIERLSFPEYLNLRNGVPFDPGNTDTSRPRELLEYYASQIRLLPEGDYNLTPERWTSNTHNHHLTVLADGTGIYRALPKDQNVGITSRERIGDVFVMTAIPGGRVVYLPKDAEFVTLAGSINLDDPHLVGRIFEIVHFIPGASPSH